jgi:hypothetical protein
MPVRAGQTSTSLPLQENFKKRREEEENGTGNEQVEGVHRTRSCLLWGLWFVHVGVEDFQ